MQKTNINPAILQPFFESAANAADKGQAQFLTPAPWAQALARPLPRYRKTIADLTCGAGTLLDAASRSSTSDLLGCDIDPGLWTLDSGLFIPADLCRLYPLLRAVQFEADLFTLNPPWDLHWYRDRLSALADSDLPTVRAAFAARDPRQSRSSCSSFPDSQPSTPKPSTLSGTIDSTIATLCIALDRCSVYGEGYLIANESTLQRLIFAPGASHSPLAAHVWAHLVVDGNICTGPQPSTFNLQPSTFKTGILYFAREHDTGIAKDRPAEYVLPNNLLTVEKTCGELSTSRLDLRTGPEAKSYVFTLDSAEKWKAAAGEWQRLTRPDRPQWNLTLRSNGNIHTDLTLFDNHSGRVTKAQAGALFDLHGKHPMQLVMQRQQRQALEAACTFSSPWRVDPALRAAVELAVAEYHAVRAPLYPLSAIQRLGYIDECDFLECSKDLYE